MQSVRSMTVEVPRVNHVIKHCFRTVSDQAKISGQPLQQGRGNTGRWLHSEEGWTQCKPTQNAPRFMDVGFNQLVRQLVLQQDVRNDWDVFGLSLTVTT